MAQAESQRQRSTLQIDEKEPSKHYYSSQDFSSTVFMIEGDTDFEPCVICGAEVQNLMGAEYMCNRHLERKHGISIGPDGKIEEAR